MMKGILEFNLDDPDDKMAHKRCVKSLDMALAFWDIFYETKRYIEDALETDDCKNYDKWEAMDFIYKALSDKMEEYHLDLEELVS